VYGERDSERVKRIIPLSLWERGNFLLDSKGGKGGWMLRTCVASNHPYPLCGYSKESPLSNGKGN